MIKCCLAAPISHRGVELVQVMSPPLLIQFCAKATRKAAKDSPAPALETKKLHLLTSDYSASSTIPAI